MQKYSKDCCIFINMDEYLPSFWKVESILHTCDTLYLLAHHFETVSFDQHFNAYEVYQKGELAILNIVSLVDFHDLGISTRYTGWRYVDANDRIKGLVDDFNLVRVLQFLFLIIFNLYVLKLICARYSWNCTIKITFTWF